MKGFKFEVSNKELREGFLVYKCKKGFFCVGYVKILKNQIFIVSRIESLIKKIEEAYKDFETENPEDLENIEELEVICEEVGG